MANKRKQKALHNVAAILLDKPKMVSQVSTETLQQIPLPGHIGIPVKKELSKRSASGDYTFRTPRKKR